MGGNRDSRTPKITGDGRFVAFASDASNLTARDTNNTADIFVFDRSKVVMKRASLDGAGMQTLTDNAEPSLSSNGRFVAFSGVDSTTPGGVRQIFLRDCLLGTTTLVTTVAGGVTEGDGDSGSPTLSANGRFLAFQSVATDLVPGDTNGFQDIFVFDRTTGVLARVSVNAAGCEYVYRLGRDECALLKETIAKTCRLTNLNINTQIQQHNNQPPRLHINGNANFTISLKEEAAGAAE